jgi:hypothetical protein
MFSFHNKIIQKAVFLVVIIQNFFSEQSIRLNNIDPYPLFSSHTLIHNIENIEKNINTTKCDCERDLMRISIMPFYQSANSGTDIYGKSTLTYYDVSNVNQQATSNNSIQNTSSNNNNSQQLELVNTIPLPMGAIPEAFSFFPLFYNWSDTSPTEKDIYYNKYTTSNTDYDISEYLISNRNIDSSWGNVVSKIIARYLGYNHVPWYTDTSKKDTQLGFDPLYYDYSNYRNNFFSIISTQCARDPEKLFGYGYFDMKYQKYGIRALLEIFPFDTDIIKISIQSGFAQLDIDSINLIDTTTLSDGPSATNMMSFYGDRIHQGVTGTSNLSTGSTYPNQWNTYQLNSYDNDPFIDNAPDGNVYNKYNTFTTTEDNPNIPDQFKTLYIQNVQNNISALARILNQDLTSYHVNSVDDVTVTIKTQASHSIKKSKKKKQFSIDNEPYEFTLLNVFPFASFHTTFPCSPKIPNEKVFAKPIGNNGHYEYGAFLGCMLDFPETIALNFDFGFSFFSRRTYTCVPTPFKSLEEGIFTYSSDFIKKPGPSISFGVGMQTDWFIKPISIFAEYRYINHSSDTFSNINLNDLLDQKTIEDIHTAPTTSITDPSNTAKTIDQQYSPGKGVLYMESDFTESDLPYPFANTNIAIQKMEDRSSWSVHMINASVKWLISNNASLSVIWQQPFSMKNSYNSTTFGFSLEVII